MSRTIGKKGLNVFEQQTLADRNLPILLRNIFLVIKNNQRMETITRVFYRMYVGWGTLLSMGSVFRDGEPWRVMVYYSRTG